MLAEVVPCFRGIPLEDHKASLPQRVLQSSINWTMDFKVATELAALCFHVAEERIGLAGSGTPDRLYAVMRTF